MEEEKFGKVAARHADPHCLAVIYFGFKAYSTLSTMFNFFSFCFFDDAARPAIPKIIKECILLELGVDGFI